MKILEAQSAILSNYEVLLHLNTLRAQPRTKGPRLQNVETVLKEVTDYLSSSIPHKGTTVPPSRCALPAYTAPDYSAESIATLLRELAPYIHSAANPKGLYKNEVLMIVNLRPADLGLLDCIVEECDERFSEEDQASILTIVGRCLGGTEVEEEE